MKISLGKLIKVFPPKARSILSIDDMVLTLDDDEGVEEALFFSAKNWDQIEINILHAHYSAFYFFSPQCYAYFAPSIIWNSFIDFQSVHLAVILLLKDFSCEDRGIEVLNFFDAKQLSVILCWLDFLSKYEDEYLIAREVSLSRSRVETALDDGLKVQ